MEKITLKHMRQQWEQRLLCFCKHLHDESGNRTIKQKHEKAYLLKKICKWHQLFFSLWNTEREEITHFIEQTNNHHTLIKFTTEISENKVTFLYTIVYKGERFNSTPILDVRKH